MLSLFPRLLKFRTAPLLSLSPYQDISESESDTESREGWLREGSGRSGDEMLTLEMRGTILWNTVRTEGQESACILQAWCHMGWVLSPGCGHLMTVSVIMVIIVIMIHDTNLSLSRRVRHTTTGHQTSHKPTWSQVIEKIFRIISDTNHCILSQPAGGIKAIVRRL